MDRFWAKVDKTGECWVWTAYIQSRGYGQFKVDGKARLAHRVAYELEVGPIPDDLQLDHLCRNRACVNPAHLEAVTCAENIRRGENANAAKTHCKRGHEFTPENTHVRSTGYRMCRACRRVAA